MLFRSRTALDGASLAQIPVEFSNIWAESGTKITILDGIWAVYLTFRGEGSGSLKAFALY